MILNKLVMKQLFLIFVLLGSLAGRAQVLIDSYNVSNYDEQWGSYLDHGEYLGQAFVVTTPCLIDSCKFYLRKYGSPTGDAWCEIYRIGTGTYGTDAKPVNKPGSGYLCKSSLFDVATLSSTLRLIKFTYTGADRIVLPIGYYCVIFTYQGGNSTNYLGLGRDDTSPSHAGNEVISYSGGSFSAFTIRDIIFYVYGIKVNYNIFLMNNF